MDATIRARVDDALKKDVEVILASQGLNMSQAIRMMLRKTKETGALPFDLPVPNTLPGSVPTTSVVAVRA